MPLTPSGNTGWVNARIEIVVPMKVPPFVSPYRKQDAVADVIEEIAGYLPAHLREVMAGSWEDVDANGEPT